MTRSVSPEPSAEVHAEVGEGAGEPQQQVVVEPEAAAADAENGASRSSPAHRDSQGPQHQRSSTPSPGSGPGATAVSAPMQPDSPQLAISSAVPAEAAPQPPQEHDIEQHHDQLANGVTELHLQSGMDHVGLDTAWVCMYPLHVQYCSPRWYCSGFSSCQKWARTRFLADRFHSNICVVTFSVVIC